MLTEGRTGTDLISVRLRLENDKDEILDNLPFQMMQVAKFCDGLQCS